VLAETDIILLCSSSDDTLLYNEFVKRFLPDVLRECEQICKKRKVDPHVGQQIAHETFERVRRYKSFKSDRIKISNERKGILLYLYRFCVRLFNTYFNDKKETITDHRTYFDDILTPQEKSPIDVQALKSKKELAVLILQKLNVKERKIILTDLDYKRHHKYLPEDVIDALVQELNIKRDTVRKIRERAIEKIKNAINEINQG
jgi:DNA-directed RNA polymerase specialized sigma24 family protein